MKRREFLKGLFLFALSVPLTAQRKFRMPPSQPTVTFLTRIVTFNGTPVTK